MASLYTHQDENIRKTWFLMAAFLVVFILLGWAVSAYLGNPGILYGAVGFALILNIWSYWYSDKVAIRMAGAVPMPDEGEFKEAHNIVENLAITAGLPKPKLYVIHDPAPNAFATGRNAERAAVAVTTGLLSIMERHELEGVLAHELSHIGNRDILISTIVVVLVGAISIIADMFLRMSMFGGNRDRNTGALVAVLAVAAAILTPIAATLIQLAISRKREFLADASGALLTRYPEGLASALGKIGSYRVPMRKAHTATAHLFIANPFGASAGRSFAKLFMTHPPVEERVAALLGKG